MLKSISKSIVHLINIILKLIKMFDEKNPTKICIREARRNI